MTSPAHEHPARSLWKRVETVHAVTYFAPECRDANADVGLRGFWMGYFGARAAPLGAVGPGVVEATFFNFAPRMVRRAIPDAWTFATPSAILEQRPRAAAAALRRVAPTVDDVATDVSASLERVVEAADDAGRPLFAANRDLELPDEPVERLWQLTTCLREQRGDGHVAALTAAGVDGCEAHVLHVAESGAPPEMIRAARGWTEDEWAAASDRLTSRGLLSDGALTPAGGQLRRSIEATTDDLAAAALRPLGDRLEGLGGSLDPVARAVATAGDVVYPNPMGLPSVAAR